MQSTSTEIQEDVTRLSHHVRQQSSIIKSWNTLLGAARSSLMDKGINVDGNERSQLSKSLTLICEKSPVSNLKQFLLVIDTMAHQLSMQYRYKSVEATCILASTGLEIEIYLENTFSNPTVEKVVIKRSGPNTYQVPHEDMTLKNDLTSHQWVDFVNHMHVLASKIRSNASSDDGVSPGASDVYKSETATVFLDDSFEQEINKLVSEKFKDLNMKFQQKSCGRPTRIEFYKSLADSIVERKTGKESGVVANIVKADGPKSISLVFKPSIVVFSSVFDRLITIIGDEGHVTCDATKSSNFVSLLTEQNTMQCTTFNVNFCNNYQFWVFEDNLHDHMSAKVVSEVQIPSPHKLVEVCEVLKAQCVFNSLALSCKMHAVDKEIDESFEACKKFKFNLSFVSPSKLQVMFEYPVDVDGKTDEYLGFILADINMSTDGAVSTNWTRKMSGSMDLTLTVGKLNEIISKTHSLPCLFRAALVQLVGPEVAICVPDFNSAPNNGSDGGGGDSDNDNRPDHANTKNEPNLDRYDVKDVSEVEDVKSAPIGDLNANNRSFYISPELRLKPPIWMERERKLKLLHDKLLKTLRKPFGESFWNLHDSGKVPPTATVVANIKNNGIGSTAPNLLDLFKEVEVWEELIQPKPQPPQVLLQQQVRNQNNFISMNMPPGQPMMRDLHPSNNMTSMPGSMRPKDLGGVAGAPQGMMSPTGWKSHSNMPPPPSPLGGNPMSPHYNMMHPGGPPSVGSASINSPVVGGGPVPMHYHQSQQQPMMMNPSGHTMPPYSQQEMMSGMVRPAPVASKSPKHRHMSSASDTFGELEMLQNLAEHAEFNQQGDKHGRGASQHGSGGGMMSPFCGIPGTAGPGPLQGPATISTYGMGPRKTSIDACIDTVMHSVSQPGPSTPVGFNPGTYHSPGSYGSGQSPGVAGALSQSSFEKMSPGCSGGGTPSPAPQNTSSGSSIHKNEFDNILNYADRPIKTDVYDEFDFDKSEPILAGMIHEGTTPPINPPPGYNPAHFQGGAPGRGGVAQGVGMRMPQRSYSEGVGVGTQQQPMMSAGYGMTQAIPATNFNPNNMMKPTGRGGSMDGRAQTTTRGRGRGRKPSVQGGATGAPVLNSDGTVRPLSGPGSRGGQIRRPRRARTTQGGVRGAATNAGVLQGQHMNPNAPMQPQMIATQVGNNGSPGIKMRMMNYQQGESSIFPQQHMTPMSAPPLSVDPTGASRASGGGIFPRPPFFPSGAPTSQQQQHALISPTQRHESIGYSVPGQLRASFDDPFDDDRKPIQSGGLVRTASSVFDESDLDDEVVAGSAGTVTPRPASAASSNREGSRGTTHTGDTNEHERLMAVRSTGSSISSGGDGNLFEIVAQSGGPGTCSISPGGSLSQHQSAAAAAAARKRKGSLDAVIGKLHNKTAAQIQGQMEIPGRSFTIEEEEELDSELLQRAQAVPTKRLRMADQHSGSTSPDISRELLSTGIMESFATTEDQNSTDSTSSYPSLKLKIKINPTKPNTATVGGSTLENSLVASGTSMVNTKIAVRKMLQQKQKVSRPKAPPTSALQAELMQAGTTVDTMSFGQEGGVMTSMQRLKQGREKKLQKKKTKPAVDKTKLGMEKSISFMGGNVGGVIPERKVSSGGTPTKPSALVAALTATPSAQKPIGLLAASGNLSVPLEPETIPFPLGQTSESRFKNFKIPKIVDPPGTEVASILQSTASVSPVVAPAIAKALTRPPEVGFVDPSQHVRLSGGSTTPTKDIDLQGRYQPMAKAPVIPSSNDSRLQGGDPGFGLPGTAPMGATQKRKSLLPIPGVGPPGPRPIPGVPGLAQPNMMSNFRGSMQPIQQLPFEQPTHIPQSAPSYGFRPRQPQPFRLELPHGTGNQRFGAPSQRSFQGPPLGPSYQPFRPMKPQEYPDSPDDDQLIICDTGLNPMGISPSQSIDSDLVQSASVTPQHTPKHSTSEHDLMDEALMLS